jgi:hypothetical protein
MTSFSWACRARRTPPALSPAAQFAPSQPPDAVYSGARLGPGLLDGQARLAGGALVVELPIHLERVPALRGVGAKKYLWTAPRAMPSR